MGKDTVNVIAEKFLWCRDVGHHWNSYDVRRTRSEVTRRREMHRVLLCTNCSTLRTDMMSLDGVMLRRSYSYPDGYLLNEQPRLTPADRAMIRRINTENARKPSQ